MSKESKPTNQTIIAAVKSNRGGLANATDTQVLTIWRSLDAATQETYLKSLKSKGTESHADCNAPE